MGSVNQSSNIHPVLEEQFTELQELYPDLCLYMNANGAWAIRGEISFEAEHEGALFEESFRIMLILPAGYPASPPKAFEIGNRIPSNYHKMDDGSLCLAAPIAVQMDFSENPRLVSYVNNQVIQYLVRYCLYEREKTETWGELFHGARGIREYYEELFATDNFMEILWFLTILSKGKYRGHHQCPCGSGKRLRDCHGSHIERRLLVRSQGEFERDLNYLWLALSEEEKAQLRQMVERSDEAK
jgi:hypothetical protein